VSPRHEALSSDQGALQSIRDREFAYLLSGTRLRAKQRIPKVDIGSVHLAAVNEGDVLELPRWIAEVLVKMELCEIQEESFSSEVFKAVTREKIAGIDQLAGLHPDFYLKIRRHLAFADDATKIKPAAVPELERTKTLIYDLIALRLRKILNIAASLSPPPDIREKLTPEEYQIFDTVYTLLQSWRMIAMEGR
jgi:DNA replication factor GINS